MSTQAAIYDLTLFDKDGDPLWGTFSSGVVTESSFQTPDPDKSHDRPWIHAPPRGASPSRVDFINGSSEIGDWTVPVLDVRKTSTDQTSGTLTEKIDQAVGGRAILRRWDETNSEWITLLDGLTYTYRVDEGKLVVYRFQIRDGREFERNGELFSSNFVLWGEDGKQGPPINYGKYPANDIAGDFTGFMLDKVGPYDSVSVGDLDHFRSHTGGSPTDGIHFGFVAVTADSGDLKLPDLGWPTQRTDGLYYYEDVRIRWRAKGSGDDWTVLTEMPASVYQNVVESARAIFRKDSGSDEAYAANGLYMASTDSDDLPNDRQEIEFQVLAEKITEDTPFFWDGGTLGDLLQEIVDGNHTDDPPEEQYDTSALTTFRSTSPKARFILREPVKDRRKWVEENIYKAALVAPAFNSSQEIYPASWELPDNTETISELNATGDDIEPVGEWEHGGDNAIGKVEYTYIREHMDPIDTIMQSRKIDKRWWFDDEITERVVDPDDDRAPWQRLVETEVTQSQSESTAAPGSKTLTYAPITIRSIAGVDGSPVFGDVQDEAGNRLFRRAADTVLPRFKIGAPTFVADVVATDTNLAFKVGDWLRVNVDWLPEYATGKRGLRTFMQIYAISDVGPARRKFYLVSGNVPDPTADTDLVAADETDCFTGGTLFPAPDGSSLRFFSGDGTLTNTCGEAKTVKVLAIAGGGGGGEISLGAASAGGGGGAGGVLGVTTELEVTIGAGEAIPVRIGSGGSAGNEGEDTVLWVDTNDGTALDPATDPQPTDTTADGGGEGGAAAEDAGGGGGSGGGGGTGGTTSNSGQAGGSGTTGEGNDGGDATGNGGGLVCLRGAGGGGGSFAGAGSDGKIQINDGVTEGGAGGAASTLSDWGVTAGGGGQGGAAQKKDDPSASCSNGGGEFETAGSAGSSGYGSGGGGAAGDAAAATSGSAGFFAVRYAGAHTTLSAPTVTSSTVTSENQVKICVEGSDWPTVSLDGYRVRVEYAATASGDSEPSATSSDWQLAGYLEAAGCVTTDSVPTGAKVWHRVRAEADDFLPSDWGTTGSDTTAETPGLLKLRLTLDDSDPANPTVTWDENSFTDIVRIRGKVHDSDDDVTPDLTKLEDLWASEGTFAPSLTVGEGRFLTVDVESWTAKTYDTIVGADSPAGYWRLGEDSGTTASDSSGNNRDGTYTGDPTLGTTGLLTGDDDTAVTFDGDGDYVVVGDDAAWDSDTLTLEALVTTSASSVQQIICRDGDTDRVWQFRMNADGKVRVILFIGSSAIGLSGTSAINDGETHHVAATYDGADIRVYVDGEEENSASQTGSIDDGANDVWIGARERAGPTDEWTGVIDEPAIYGSALTAAQIAQHYDAATRSGTVSATDTLDTEGRTDRVSIEHVAETLADRDDLADDLGEVVVDKDLDDVLDKSLNQIRSYS